MGLDINYRLHTDHNQESWLSTNWSVCPTTVGPNHTAVRKPMRGLSTPSCSSTTVSVSELPPASLSAFKKLQVLPARSGANGALEAGSCSFLAASEGGVGGLGLPGSWVEWVAPAFPVWFRRRRGVGGDARKASWEKGSSSGARAAGRQWRRRWRRAVGTRDRCSLSNPQRFPEAEMRSRAARSGGMPGTKTKSRNW